MNSALSIELNLFLLFFLCDRQFQPVSYRRDRDGVGSLPFCKALNFFLIDITQFIDIPGIGSTDIHIKLIGSSRKLTQISSRVKTDILQAVFRTQNFSIIHLAGFGLGLQRVLFSFPVNSDQGMGDFVSLIKINIPDPGFGVQIQLTLIQSQNRVVECRVDPGWFIDQGNRAVTRAQFATILYSLAGKPEVDYEPVYSDVPGNEWFAAPIMWAKEEGIATGYASGKFGVNDPISREQIALMLYKYKDGEPADGDYLSGFPDAYQTDDWGYEGLNWAVEQNIMSGNANGTLDPLGKATRVQCAVMISKIA